MLLLDISLRFPAITLLMLLAGLVAMEARLNRKARLLLIWLMSLIALMLTNLPEPLELSWFAREAIWIIHIPNMVLLWWFALSLFNDDFRLGPTHLSVFALTYLIALGLRLVSQLEYEPGIDLMILFNRGLRLAILVHLLWVAIKGREGDLVNIRRRARIWLGCATLGYIVLMLSAESLLYVSSGNNLYITTGMIGEPSWTTPLRTALLLPFIIASCVLFIRGKLDLLVFESQDHAVEHAAHAEIDVKDSLAYKRLMRAIEADYVYRQPGLSIGGLADIIQIPEHQLRALINKGLGYRNFSSFLNAYRIAEAKRLLSDPLKARTQILIIANDVGYASLPTFNRAFRAAEMRSPRQFRADALSESSIPTAVTTHG